MAGTGLDQTAFFWTMADQDLIGLTKFLLYNVIIVSMSQILVVIRLYRFDKFFNAKKGNVYFASRNKSAVRGNLPLTNHV